MKGLKSALALSLIESGYSLKRVAKMLKVKHQWLLAVISTPMPEFKFGVEIETLYEGQLFLPKEYKMFYEVGYHSNGGADISNPFHWRQTWDGSLGCYGEYVSPILEGKKGFEILETFCESLNDSEAEVSVQCGLHVHIDRNHFSGSAHIQRFVNLYEQLEDSIDAMMPRSRRASNNQYCISLRDESPSRTRYTKVNLQNSATVEVRHHSGTTNFDKIYNWFKILSVLVETSRKETPSNCNDVAQLCKGSVAAYVNKRKKEVL